jgi:hypothetical protein
MSIMVAQRYANNSLSYGIIVIWQGSNIVWYYAALYQLIFHVQDGQAILSTHRMMTKTKCDMTSLLPVLHPSVSQASEQPSMLIPWNTTLLIIQQWLSRPSSDSELIFPLSTVQSVTNTRYPVFSAWPDHAVCTLVISIGEWQKKGKIRTKLLNVQISMIKLNSEL